MVDYLLSEEQKKQADVKLLWYESIILLKYGAHNGSSFVVHANVAFSVTENWFFWDFLNHIRPFSTMPSYYMCCHTPFLIVKQQGYSSRRWLI
jgi:hypothetical protein